MTQVCVIFGAGEYYAARPWCRPRVCDCGRWRLDHTRQLGIVPDVVVGDFDSLEGRPPRTDVRTIALPAAEGRSGHALRAEGRLVGGLPRIPCLWRFGRPH